MAYRTAIAFFAAAALAASPARAYPLLDGLGGPVGYGPHTIPGNDDGSYCGDSPTCMPYTAAPIDVHASFPNGLRFFGMTFTSLYLNNNGNVTFGGSLGEYTPAAFPIANQRMIAPWWADVDTRGGGAPTHNGVFWSATTGRFVATWHNVGYFASHDDKQNDFQLILTDRSDVSLGDFDVEFRYNRCEWTTGDASGGTNGFGGTPAQAGFDAGNLRDYYALPGSRTMAILNVCTTSNVGAPGRWVFHIRSGVISICGNGVLEPGEQCDDGNTRNDDGCSSTCRLERDVPPDVIEDVPEDVGFDVARDEGVDVPELPDVPNPPDASEDVPGDVPVVGTDAGADAECDGWRCGRELWLQGSAGPVGSCECSAPGAAGGAPGGAAALVGALGAAVALGKRRRSRRSSHRA